MEGIGSKRNDRRLGGRLGGSSATTSYLVAHSKTKRAPSISLLGTRADPSRPSRKLGNSGSVEPLHADGMSSTAVKNVHF